MSGKVVSIQPHSEIPSNLNDGEVHIQKKSPTIWLKKYQGAVSLVNGISDGVDILSGEQIAAIEKVFILTIFSHI